MEGVVGISVLGGAYSKMRFPLELNDITPPENLIGILFCV